MAQWCQFAYAGAAFYGIRVGDQVQIAEGAPYASPRMTRRTLPIESVEFLPPAIPYTFFAVGFNYRSHILHAQSRGSAAAKIPLRPEVGYRANNALIGHDANIVIPPDCTGPVEAEGEVVAVFGRKLRHCSRAEALEGIFGWTIGNDVSAREWQRADRTFWRCKNSDTFKPMGPWIDTEFNPANAHTRVRVNGDQVCEFATGEMIFDAVDYIVEISRYITIHPGDVLWMGAESTAAIAPGDTVEIDISGIGTLRNTVVAEQSLRHLATS